MQVLHQQKGWDRGGGWGHPQGAVHMAAVRLGCKRNMVGTKWANSRPGCLENATLTFQGVHFWQGRLLGLQVGVCLPRKCYSHLLGGSFLAGKASWAPSGCLPTKKMLLSPFRGFISGREGFLGSKRVFAYQEG